MRSEAVEARHPYRYIRGRRQTIHFMNATGTVTTMFYQLSDNRLTIDASESLDRDPMHYTRE